MYQISKSTRILAIKLLIKFGSKIKANRTVITITVAKEMNGIIQFSVIARNVKNDGNKNQQHKKDTPKME